MPSALTSDNEVWEAYRTVISQVEVELKEVLVSGSDIATMNIVPDVTAMYREFAEDIRKVCSFVRQGLSEWHGVSSKRGLVLGVPGLQHVVVADGSLV